MASRAALLNAAGPQASLFLSGPLSGLFAPESQQIKAATFEWRDIDFSNLLAWGLKDEEPPMTETDLIDLGTLKLTDMETFVGEKRANAIAEATVSAMEFTWLIPSKFRAFTKGAYL